jgi:hypothetical protein
MTKQKRDEGVAKKVPREKPEKEDTSGGRVLSLPFKLHDFLRRLHGDCVFLCGVKK